MRLVIAVAFVALGGLGTAQGQKIDCQKLVSSCTGMQSAAKFGSPLACLKRAPAPIQRACASIISKYNMCATRCDKGTRGSLCRSKCGSVAQASAKPKSARPVLKKPVVRKAGPTLKRPMGKKVRPMPAAKTGKYQGAKKTSVKAPSKKVRPMPAAKTGKYQGAKKTSVKAPSKKVRPMPAAKPGKYQRTTRRSVPKRTTNTTGASKTTKKPTAGSLRYKSSGVRGLKSKSGLINRARMLNKKSGKTSKASVKRSPTKNVGLCKKDSRGRLVCKPVKTKSPVRKK